MFNKSLKNLTYQDIHDLIVFQKQGEGTNLEFKEKIDNPDKAKYVLAKEVSAFANSGGGFLIYGVNDNREIIGIEPTVGGRGVIEWINQVTHSNIQPQVIYPDPKIIELPDNSTKVLLVIEIPESISKPHMVNEKNCYYIRFNDGSKPASHYQVRDMFEYSKNRTNEIKDFLIERNLYNPKSPHFGINDLSESIVNSNIKKLTNQIPKLIVSVVPNTLGVNRLIMPISKLRAFIENYPDSYNVFYDPRYDNFVTRNDSILIKRHESGNDTFYFQIHKDGYIEIIMSQQISWENSDSNSKNQNSVLILASAINSYLLSLLNFLSVFYEFINYSEEVTLQISLVNIKGSILYDFHNKYDMTWYFHKKLGINKFESNVQIVEKFMPQNLTLKSRIELVKNISNAIHRTFNLSEELCFLDDKLKNNSFNWNN